MQAFGWGTSPPPVRRGALGGTAAMVAETSREPRDGGAGRSITGGDSKSRPRVCLCPFRDGRGAMASTRHQAAPGGAPGEWLCLGWGSLRFSVLGGGATRWQQHADQLGDGETVPTTTPLFTGPWADAGRAGSQAGGHPALRAPGPWSPSLLCRALRCPWGAKGWEYLYACPIRGGPSSTSCHSPGPCPSQP